MTEIRPYLKESLAVSLNGPDRVVMQAVRIAGLMSVVDEWELMFEESADPFLGTHPHHPFRVFKYCFDGVVMEAVRIARLCGVPHDVVALTVELQQPCVERSQPERPLAVFIDAGHARDALAAWFLWVERVAREFPAFHVQGAQPTYEF